MPEDKYNFSPESLNIPGSDYKGVRTFALEVRRIATANYAFWSALTGDPMPAWHYRPQWPGSVEDQGGDREVPERFLRARPQGRRYPDL